MTNTQSAGRKWFSLILLALGAGIIFELPYMRYTWYDPLIKGLGMNNADFGLSMSIYGIMAMIFYLPSGLLADRISHRKLIGISLTVTGIGGFYLATWPSYIGHLVLFGIWGITSILTFWGAYLKAVSMLGDEKEQGRLFSFAEGARGIMTSLAALAAIFIFKIVGEQNFAAVIWMYSIVCIAIGVLSWFFLPDNKVTDKGAAGNILKDIFLVIRLPITWIIAIIVFMLYTGYTTSSYLTPYMNTVLGMTGAGAGIVAFFKNQISRPLGGLLAGVVSRKMGSSVPPQLIAIIIVAAALLLLIILPAGPGVITVALASSIVIGLLFFSLRGLYLAPVGESKGFPVSLIGAALGFISVFCYSSDIFNFVLVGKILDANAGAAGYKIIFLYMLGLLAVAFIFLLILMRIIKKNKIHS